MLSFWEKTSLVSYDYIIAGSGITGLSTACSIKEKDPEATVLILERGLLPTGASTKNAGFACIGSLSEKLSDLELMGKEAFLNIIEDRWKGLAMLRKRLGDDQIGYRSYGGYELMMQEDDVQEDKMHFMNDLLEPLLGKEIFSFDPGAAKTFGFNKEIVKNMIRNRCEGQIDTGMMMSSLWTYASQKGIRIITGAQITGFEESPTGVDVSCSDGAMIFKAGKLIICTNAFTKTLLPGEEINPGRGQVLITSEIPGLKVKGIFHFDEGYYYFRNLGGRILFGGGRNIDFEKESTTDFGLNNTIQEKLEGYLKDVIIPGEKFSITDRWAGIMAFGTNKLPIVKQVSSRVIAGVRLNGMGIALGSRIGEKLSEMALGI